MPIYEFKCYKCGHEFEFMKLKSNETASCTNCGATGEKTLEKLPPKNIGLDFKGPNWAGKGKKGY